MTGYPFRHELVPTGFTGKEKETFAERPEIIVRQDGYPASTLLQLERAHIFRGLLAELSGYGIATPNPRFVISYDTQYATETTATQIVADRVHGQGLNIEEPGELPPEVFMQTLTGIVKYYKNKIQTGGDLLEDLALYQCMHGTTVHDKIPKTYFVDLDIYTTHYNPREPDKDTVESLCYGLVSHAEYAQQLQERAGIDARPVVQDIAEAVYEPPYVSDNDDEIAVLQNCIAAVHARTADDWRDA